MSSSSATQDVKLRMSSKSSETNYSIGASDIAFVKKRESVREQFEGLGSGAGANQRLRVRIPASDTFMSNKNCYIQLQVKISGANNLTADQKAYIRLAKPGASAFIHSCRVSSNRGSVLESCENIGLLTSILQTKFPKDYKDSVSSASGCFTGGNRLLEETKKMRAPLTGSSFSVNAGNGGNPLQLVGVGSKFSDECKNGSIIYFQESTGAVVKRTVDAVADNTHLTVTANMPTFTASYGEVEGEIKVKTAEGKMMDDLFSANGKFYNVLPSWSGFLSQNPAYYPLWCENGLQIELTLNGNDIALSPNASNVSYQITDAYFCYDRLTLAEQVTNKIKDAYRKEGLSFQIPALHHVERNLRSSATVQENYTESITSCDGVWIVARDTKYQTSGVPSYKFEELKPSAFHCEVGRQRFPSVYGAEAGQNKQIDSFYRKLAAENALGMMHAGSQNFEDYKKNTVLSVDLRNNDANGARLTGINLNSEQLKVVMSGLEQKERALSVVFAHSVFIRLKDKMPAEVLA